MNLPLVHMLRPDALAESERRFQPPPLRESIPPHTPISAISSASPLEALTIKKLRTNSGWWEGDAQALKTLREYAAQIRATS